MTKSVTTSTLETTNVDQAFDFAAQGLQAFETLKPGEVDVVSAENTDTGEKAYFVGIGGVSVEDAAQGGAVLSFLSGKGLIPHPWEVKKMEVFVAPFGSVVLLKAA